MTITELTDRDGFYIGTQIGGPTKSPKAHNWYTIIRSRNYRGLPHSWRVELGTAGFDPADPAIKDQSDRLIQWQVYSKGMTMSGAEELVYNLAKRRLKEV